MTLITFFLVVSINAILHQLSNTIVGYYVRCNDLELLSMIQICNVEFIFVLVNLQQTTVLIVIK
jgi:hypothetical protein